MKKSLYRQVAATVLIVLLALLGTLYFNMDRLYQDLPFPKKPVKPADVKVMSSKAKIPHGSRMTVTLCQPEDEFGLGIFENMKKALQYAKIPYKVKRTDQLEDALFPDPYSVLVLFGENPEKWPLSKIQTYAKQGGNLMFTNRFQDPAWDSLLGIEKNRGYVDGVKGLSVSNAFFPGYPEISPKSEYFSNSMLNVKLNRKAHVFIKAQKQPFLWTYSYGKGKVVFLNNTAMQDKSSRGMLLQSLTLAAPAMAAGQFAGKIMYIDDFPAPVVKMKNKQIYQDYGMTYDEFYDRIWWPDMKKISSDYHFHYTGASIGTYENDPNLSRSHILQLYEEDLLKYGRQLLASGGELALHGYNHQSLILKGDKTDRSFHYRLWESRGEMERALHQMKSIQAKLFPKASISTYVPPSNTIGPAGIAAVAHSYPDIGVISSLYLGTDKLGSLIQEFGYDEKYPSLYNFPRITSGYQFTAEDQFQMADAVANFGIVSHFVHPDDVLDEQRSEKGGWKGLKKNYTRLQDFLIKTYPYLTAYRQSDAEREMAVYQKGKWNISYGNHSIELHGYKVPVPSHLLIRVNEGKKIQTGTRPYGSIQQINPSIYAVTLTKPDAVISLEEGKKK